MVMSAPRGQVQQAWGTYNEGAAARQRPVEAQPGKKAAAGRRPSPADPLHPRALAVVDADEADVVRRVLERFVAAASPRTIAAELNRDGVRAPYEARGAGGALG